jgi:hypothetical protein
MGLNSTCKHRSSAPCHGYLFQTLACRSTRAEITQQPIDSPIKHSSAVLSLPSHQCVSPLEVVPASNRVTLVLFVSLREATANSSFISSKSGGARLTGKWTGSERPWIPRKWVNPLWMTILRFQCLPSNVSSCAEVPEEV